MESRPKKLLDQVRAKPSQHLPTVLSRAEVQAVLHEMSGIHLLIARLLYGSGIRLMECIRLRVKDLDFEYRQIAVRDAKGAHDRYTLLPGSLVEPLQDHLIQVKRTHAEDLSRGYVAVYLPFALAEKYPNANREWIWQYVFPSHSLSPDEQDGVIRRFHMSETGLQKAVKAAVQKAGTPKKVGCHTFRHCFATHLLEAGYYMQVVVETQTVASPVRLTFRLLIGEGSHVWDGSPSSPGGCESSDIGALLIRAFNQSEWAHAVCPYAW